MRTTEELKLGFDRIAAAQACRNLMSTYTFYHTAGRYREYVELWAKRDDCRLQMPWGRYEGYSGICDCYLKDHGNIDDRIKDGKLMGPPFAAMHLLDTEVVEVAEDCKTAKGCWLSPGHESMRKRSKDEPQDPFASDPNDFPAPRGRFAGKELAQATWAWSKYAVDFIRDENGEWKIWKMQLFPLFKADFYIPWIDYPQVMRVDTSVTDEDGKGFCYEWSPDTVYPPDQPEPPLPYRSYEDVKPCC